jgi:hypothetical protein
MKFCQVLAGLFRWGKRAAGRPVRQTDMAKLIVAFRTFANASKNGFACHNIFISPLVSTINGAMRTLNIFTYA